MTPAKQIPLGPVGYRLTHELEGLLVGFQADGAINSDELGRLTRWLEAAEPYRAVRPFSELITKVDAALVDGHITLEECADLIFVAQKFTTVNPHFDAFRSGLQVLMGLIAGTAADREFTEAEIRRLSRLDRGLVTPSWALALRRV